MWSFRQPGMGLLLLFILAEIGFAAAASWQWQRGAFKDRREREFAAALADTQPAPAANFSTLRALPGDFAKAHLRGILRTDRLYLHDNRIVDGEYGVDVYAPLAIDGGHVLVNLGWIAADRSRRVAPVLPKLSAEFDAHGLIAPAPAIGLMRGDAGVTPGQPSLRLNIDTAAIARETRLAPMLDRVFWPVADPQASFRRQWQPSGMPADRHRGYALQWASFAVASLILFLMFHVRRKEVRP